MNGAQSLIGTLVKSEVDVCFTNPGTSEMHFVAALDHVPEMRAILVLFEGVATGAADGYARMMDKPAATLLHLGPGLANGLANLHNAKKARSPVVNIVGDHATYHQQWEAPLTSDVKAFATPVSHWIKSSPNATAVGQDTADAVQAANTSPGQVATLLLPADTAWEDAADYGVYQAPKAPSRPDNEAVSKAIELLSNGKKTVILIAGKALRAPGLKAANRITEKTDARAMSDTFYARMQRGAGIHGIERMPYFAEQMEETLKGVEQLIIVGSQAPVSFFAYPNIPNVLTPEGAIVHTLATPDEDGTQALEAVADALNCPAEGGATPELVRPELATGDANPFAVWAAIAHFMPENSILIDEAATSGMGSETYLANAPAHDLLALTGGSIGIGLPLALGASIACPERKVISANGDGSAMYTLQALWSQVREGCDIVNIIFSNRKYMILQVEIMRVGAENVGPKALDMFDIGKPELDWVKLAQGMGMNAMRASNADDINRAVEECMKTKGPHLIEVLI